MENKFKALEIEGKGRASTIALSKLDAKIRRLAFTDVTRTKELLLEMKLLLEKEPYPDFQFSYDLHLGFVENQLYNYKKAIMRLNAALRVQEQLGDIQQRVETLIDLSGVYTNMGEMELTNDILDESLKLLKAFPNKIMEARFLCRKGYTKLHYNNLGDAIELFLEAEKTLNGSFDDLKYKDYYFLTLIYNGLGQVYAKSNEPGKAIRAHLNAVNLCDQVGMKSRMSWHYLSVGNAYMSINDISNAEEFFKKVISIETDSSILSRALAYGNIGFLALQKKELKQALELFDKAEFIYKESNAKDFGNFAKLNFWRGQLFAELGRENKAIGFFEKAYKQASRVKDYIQLLAITKELVTHYAERNDYENAYHHQMLYENFHEKHLSEVHNRKTLELDVRYEAEKKQQEANRLKLQATKLQLKALRAQMNPHFMHNALNAIQTYISTGDVKNASSYLARFSELMRKSLDFSDLEIISLEEEIDFLREYLSLNQKLRFENNLNFKIEIDDDVEEDICGVPTMIIQPYVENAIEHGIRRIQNGNILVAFKMLDDDKLLCTIQDDGIGRDEVRRIQSEDPQFKNHQSRGTKITEDRLRILFNIPEEESFVQIIDLKDDNGKGIGTRVEIQIPITGTNMVVNEDTDTSL